MCAKQKKCLRIIDYQEQSKYCTYRITSLVNWKRIRNLYILGTFDDVVQTTGGTTLKPGVYLDVLEKSALVIGALCPQEYIASCSDTLDHLKVKYVNIDELHFNDLTALKILDLRDAFLQTIRNEELPPNLQVLDLRQTGLSYLRNIVFPDGLSKIYLSHTPLSNIENVVFPVNLSELHLNFTKLTVLPKSISAIKGLSRLNLSNLKLKCLPEWLPEMRLPFSRESASFGILLYGTIVEDSSIDMSIFDMPQEVILQWFYERENTAKPLRELKVVFLGDGEAGKTHTIARLLKDGGEVKDFKEGSTPGIVIEDKSYTIGNREIQVHFWDFGGQEILHSMHRMFLTKRTLYVVVLNVREGNQDDRARYWLHNLKSFADGAPVLLVLNKMDMNRNASVNESDLRKLYPGLTEIVKLSTLKDSEAEFRLKFMDVLLKQIGKMEILELPLVAAGRRVKEKIQSMQENYIHGDVFRQYCDECGVTGTDKVRRGLLETFGQLGVSFCYSGSMELEKHVVLRPDWITNAIYIILFNKVHAVTNGLVSHDTIFEMLTSKDQENVRRTVESAAYTRDEVKYVLEVFRKFRLSFPVETGGEFLPMLCDANSTAGAMAYENDPDALEFRMHYDYLPNNVIHRLMVERRKELDRGNVWLTGARFVCGDTGRNAVVKSEGNLIRILVRAEKEPREPQRYLDELKDTLERINQEMGLTVSQKEVIYKEGNQTACFDYEDLLDYQESGETHIRSRELKKKLLLADVLRQTDFPEDEKQKKLREDIRQACEKLQNRKIYWDASEDERTDFLQDLLSKDYIVLDQHRGGVSAGGIQSGELDLDIRQTPGDAWTALEALNLKGSSNSQLEYWNAHLKKLLDNYNHVGRSFLFHVSYVECRKDQFTKIYNDLYEHLRFYSPDGFELMGKFVQVVPLTEDPTRPSGFMHAAKCVYDCGGIPMTVYHFFVRIGE